MQIEVDLGPGVLARAMKDEDPETIIEFIRDFFDNDFSKAETSDLIRWLVQFLMDDLESGRHKLLDTLDLE